MTLTWKDRADDPCHRGYGRQTLYHFGFIGEGMPPIQPGVFLIGENGKLKPVPEGDGMYVGIALDRVLRDDGYMRQSDMTWSASPSALGEMGQFQRVESLRPRIGVNAADRAWDMSVVLDRLLSRFHADPRHEQTGFLAKSEDTIPHIFWEEDGERCYRDDFPAHARKIQTAAGWYYSSHSKHPDPPAECATDRFYKTGLAGYLTLSGQIVCLAAVLRDRLQELSASTPPGSSVNTIRMVGARTKPVLDWSDAERRDLELARGELMQFAALNQNYAGAVGGTNVVANAEAVTARSDNAPTITLPKTRRGLQRFVQTTTKDQQVLAALNNGKSYREIENEVGVSKTTVGRIAEANGLTGHKPDAVPREGTLDERKGIRERPSKRKKS